MSIDEFAKGLESLWESKEVPSALNTEVRVNWGKDYFYGILPFGAITGKGGLKNFFSYLPEINRIYTVVLNGTTLNDEEKDKFIKQLLDEDS